eukprot:jgi/Psemu1/293772/fgenesh1_pg.4029_\
MAREGRNESSESSESNDSDSDSDDVDDGSLYHPPQQQQQHPPDNHPEAASRNKHHPPASHNNTNNSTTTTTNESRVKPRWVPLYDNPWGRGGYQTGDVLLFGSQRGIGHHETLLMQQQNHHHHHYHHHHQNQQHHQLQQQQQLRYCVHPFAPGSPYTNTHGVPSDGFSVVRLDRDPLATMPWGFVVERDEFGHACLVKSVDPQSPAEAATFARLRPNDLLIAVNGTAIGGKTVAGLELELELSGPALVLVVARYRYKHADLEEEHFARVERTLLDAMDAAARDDRVCGATHRPSRKKTFWIQCEACHCWYHVAVKCIGFDERKANKDDFVWNCERTLRKRKLSENDLQRGNGNSNSNSNSRTDGVEGSRRDRRSEKQQKKTPTAETLQDDRHAGPLKLPNMHTTSRSVQKRKTAASVPAKEGAGNEAVTIYHNAAKDQTFEKGDLVIVENHAWAYVNHCGGIGNIVKAYVDEDGDRVYDVKYPALQTTEKGIMAKYIKFYSFHY